MKGNDNKNYLYVYEIKRKKLLIYTITRDYPWTWLRLTQHVVTNDRFTDRSYPPYNHWGREYR